MRTILIKIDNSFFVRNFLRTDTFALLIKEPDIRMVFLTPKDKVDYYKKEFPYPNAIFIVAPDTRMLTSERVFKFIETASIHTQTVTMIHRTDFSRSKGQMNMMKRLLIYMLRRMMWQFGAFHIWHQVIRLIYFLLPSRQYQDYFKTYKPKLVFSPSVVYDESVLLKEARKAGIKTIGMVLSWDNFYSKTLLRVWPDHLIVHTDTVREQAVRYTCYPYERIIVSGIPQYDCFFKKTHVVSRGDFFKLIGADVSKKLIVFALSGKVGLYIDRALITLLAQAIIKKEIKEPAQLLIRPYPRYDFSSDKMQELCTSVGALGLPVMAHVGQSKDNWEFDDQSIFLLSNTLAHADVVIALYTTFFIEAALFDKPLIAVGFDEREASYWESAKRFFQWDHLRELDALKGIWRVESRGELIDAINAYLADPSYFHEGRMRIVARQSQFTDGQSGKRLAEILRGFLR